MSCKINTRHVGDVVVVDISGKVTLGEGSGMVRNTIKGLVTGGERRVVLNLSGVSYMDSAGLGEMVGGYATMSNAGGEIKLLNPQGKISDLLSVTKLYSVFATFSNEAEAVRSFADAAGA